MNKKNNPAFKPRLQSSKETNVTGVKREGDGTVEKTDKEIAEAKLRENALKEKRTSETTGTPLPEGYDPDLPMNKQREFNGLV